MSAKLTASAELPRVPCLNFDDWAGTFVVTPWATAAKNAGFGFYGGEMAAYALHILGWNLSIAGVLAMNADAAVRAGVDLGIMLVAKEMQDDAMTKAAKGKAETILTPSRQLILPGSKDWGK